MLLIITIPHFVEVISWIFIIYTGIIMSHYLLLAAYSGFMIFKHFTHNKFTDIDILLYAHIQKRVSIIVPAYNEEKSIVQCVKSLKVLEYPIFEIVIVNDGSSDNCLDVLIKEFSLEKVDYPYREKIKTQEIKAIYKSTSIANEKIIVVDKINGGKADALNAGINISNYELFLAIDADSIILSDALLKLVKPFYTESEENIVATGGVVRIANSCKVMEGGIVQVNLSKKWLVRMQILEYTRVFMMSRFAWSKLNGLMIISGAIGLFKKDVVIKSGGYSKTIGEDMELVVKMRRYLYDNKIPFKIGFVPDPLCWTEVPDSWSVLFKQRDRWMRGTIDTLKVHRKLFFNRKYKTMGIFGYPFWLFCEWLAPLAEITGIAYFLFLVELGYVDWYFSAILFGAVYLFATFYSACAIVLEELTFHLYNRKSDIFKLGVASLFEPFFLHIITLLAAVKANYSYFITKTNKWGKQKRKGFEAEKIFKNN